LVNIRRVAAVSLAVAAVVWLLINKPYEGPVLLVFNESHGLTLADLPSLAALVVAAALAWPHRRDTPAV
jgi:hypothetical protein